MCALAAAGAAQAAGQQDPAPDPTVVTITGKKEDVVEKIDKTVYDTSQQPRAANGSAQDVLQATPGVSVSTDGRIAVKGNAQVTVLVDGKPTAMLSGTGDERAVALQTMSGADIASVEVITNPSAAQDANGGAILNIVLKRNRKPGTHAQVQGSASDRGLWNAGAAGDATRGPVSLHGSLGLRHDGNEKFRASQVDWNDPATGQSGRTRQTSAVFVHRVVASAAAAIDAALSDTDSVSLSARYNGRRSHPLFDVLEANRDGTADTLYHRISDGPNEQHDASAGVDYSHRDGATALKAALQHSDTVGLVDKSYRDVYVAPTLPTDASHGATRAARRLDQATLDWSRASDAGQWGAGLDLRRKVDAIDNVQATVDPTTGAETPDRATTNGYRVTTTVDAAYVTDRIQRGAWEMLLGGRAESMTLHARGAAATRWQAFDPSLHLRYAIDATADLTLSFRRSLQAPDPRDLNPSTTYVDAQNLSRGNPGLAPQRLDAWEIGTHTQGARVSGNLGAFYRTSSDTVTDARSFADGGVIVTSKQNGGNARSAGVTGSLDWKPDTRLQLGVDGGVVRVTLATPDSTGLVRQAGVSGYANARAGWRAGADEVALDAHLQSAGIAPLGRYGATSSVNLGWKHALSKTLGLTVNANDLFDGSRRTYSVTTGTFRQAGFEHVVARRLYIGFVKKIE